MKQTPLYKRHVAQHAKMVEFAGYSMPVQYTGLLAEHKAVRQAVGLFDVSHMGEVEFRGPTALSEANRLLSNDLSKLSDGQALYSVMCNPEGGIIDDVVAYRIHSERIFICVNAGTREKDYRWMRENARCEVIDRSDEFAQIAVQGPKTVEALASLGFTLGNLGRFRFVETQLLGVHTMVSRTGYTGEDGVEIYLPAQNAATLWDALLETNQHLGIQPAGLGARDSLRLEMGYMLYGQDMDESRNPLEAGLAWVVKFNKADFIGKSALEKIKQAGPSQRLVGFKMDDKKIARHGYAVVQNTQQIGVVTSGTLSPTLNVPVGLAYVNAEFAQPDSKIHIQIRNEAVAATVTKPPFYQVAT